MGCCAVSASTARRRGARRSPPRRSRSSSLFRRWMHSRRSPSAVPCYRRRWQVTPDRLERQVARFTLVLVFARVWLGLGSSRGASGVFLADVAVGLRELAVTVTVAVPVPMPVPVHALRQRRAFGDDLVHALA